MIKKIVLFYFILIIIFLLQTSNLSEFLILGTIKPDFILTYIIFASLTTTFIFSETLSFIAGITFDIASISLLGINAFAFIIISVILGNFKTKIFVEKPFSVFIVVFLSSLAYRIIYFILNLIFVVNVNFFKAMLKISIPEAFYTAIVAMVIFPLYSYIFNRR